MANLVAIAYDDLGQAQQVMGTVDELVREHSLTLEDAVVALVGVVVLYSLLILFGQFVAQGVVEEKSSRVVELLLATMRPWQLLAGKILGLGLLGLAQIVVGDSHQIGHVCLLVRVRPPLIVSNGCAGHITRIG